ncbi:MAG: GntR family transcriptional regulator, partial [Desulfobacterales bacterium]
IFVLNCYVFFTVLLAQIIVAMTSKKDATYEDLRYRIITHDLKPMAPLNEKALMDHYGLGRTPMREVMLHLQRDGLIQRFSRSGTIVSPVDTHIYKQNIEIRTVLEGLAGELAAQRITPEQLAALRQILERVQELEKEDSENLKELMQYEFDFHHLLYESTHNPKLIDILHELHAVSARFWHYQIFSKQELLDQYIDHREVLDALEKRDGRRAAETLKNHLQNVLKKLGDKVLK